jgi:putative PIN family toxin of toxin-antitoxin system
MSEAIPRVVLDTVVLVQALISGRGPGAVCVERLKVGQFILLTSDELLAELNDVPLRPALTRKYTHLTAHLVDNFVREIEARALFIPSPPNAFQLPRDPKDEPFIDVAVAGGANYIVTWNARHLTYLMKRDTVEGKDFCSRFPTIQIVDPPTFLKSIDAINAP